MATSFYGPGGGLIRGGMAAFTGGAPSVGADDLPDALEVRERLIHANSPGDIARAVALAHEVLAAGCGDDTEEERAQLRMTLAKREAPAAPALPVGQAMLPAARPAGGLGSFQSFMPLLMIGAGIAAVVWLGHVAVKALDADDGDDS